MINCAISAATVGVDSLTRAIMLTRVTVIATLTGRLIARASGEMPRSHCAQSNCGLLFLVWE